MNREIFEQVAELIKEVMSDPDIEITEKTRFFEDLEFDSILTIQLLVAAEEKFGFDSGGSEEILQAFETVWAFSEFVEKFSMIDYINRK